MLIIKLVYPFTTITLSIYYITLPNRNRTVRYDSRLLDTSAATVWNIMPEEFRNAVNVVHFKRLLTLHFIRLTISLIAITNQLYILWSLLPMYFVLTNSHPLSTSSYLLMTLNIYLCVVLVICC